MGWKCTPQVMGLVRGTPPAGQRHRANVRAIVSEMGSERVSDSETLDRSRSEQNVYTGYTSGFACADAMIADADAYRASYTKKDGTIGHRSLRGDAVIGCAVIFNPPEAECAGWTKEQYAKFYKDSSDFLEELCPDIFRQDNLRMSAEHWDEGTKAEPGHISGHIHKVYDCKSKDGKYCGNLIDAKMCDTINRTYPAFMRQRGWEMDDLDVTDWKRAKDDSSYRKKRDSKRRKSGKSVNDYIRDELQETLADVQSKEADLEQQKTDFALEMIGRRQQAEAEEKLAEAEREEEEQKLKERDDELTRKAIELQKREDKCAFKENRLKKGLDRLRDGETALQEKLGQLDEMISQLDKEPTSDSIMKTVLEKCFYLYVDRVGQTHKISAKDYADQLLRRHNDTVRGVSKRRQGLDISFIATSDNDYSFGD